LCSLVPFFSVVRSKSESDDERGHALTLIDFANKRNIPIQLEDIKSPNSGDWGNVEEMWQDLVTAEMENTQALLELGDAAAKCSDHAMSSFLQPYHMVRFRQPCIFIGRLGELCAALPM